MIHLPRSISTCPCSATFAQAWERKIVIVSPTTLLATLRTVASIWKLERQNRNAQEIARQGGLLYDRIVSFIGEMEKIGKHLDQASRTHDDADKSSFISSAK